jgi:hypothetical protein
VRVISRLLKLCQLHHLPYPDVSAKRITTKSEVVDAEALRKFFKKYRLVDTKKFEPKNRVVRI